MTASRRVVSLTEDAAGESHFDDHEIALEVNDFAPPATPFLVSSVTEASGCVVIRLPVGWVGERHRSPHRQILFCLSGALKVTASDGETRVIETGDSWLMADTRGKGHATEVVSDKPCDAAIVLLRYPD